MIKDDNQKKYQDGSNRQNTTKVVAPNPVKKSKDFKVVNAATVRTAGSPEASYVRVLQAGEVISIDTPISESADKYTKIGDGEWVRSDLLKEV